MIIDVKTALEGCGDHCKDFWPQVANITYDGDIIKRVYHCENLPQCKALIIAIKSTMYDNVKEAIQSDADRLKQNAEFWEVEK